jgi:hypothetical protein
VLPQVLALDRRAVRRRFEQRFCSTRTATEYLEVYHSLLAHSRAGTRDSWATSHVDLGMRKNGRRRHDQDPGPQPAEALRTVADRAAETRMQRYPSIAQTAHQCRRLRLSPWSATRIQSSSLFASGWRAIFLRQTCFRISRDEALQLPHQDPPRDLSGMIAFRSQCLFDLVYGSALPRLGKLKGALQCRDARVHRCTNRKRRFSLHNTNRSALRRFLCHVSDIGGVGGRRGYSLVLGATCAP